MLAALNSPHVSRAAGWGVPLVLGLWSLWLGVDANWDLYNYHLYNAFALLHGKLAVDLAAAGLQTYFNPLLDVPYYLASQVVPAPVIAFAMGALHGVGFVLLLRIAHALLPGLPPEDRFRVPLLLALAGVCSGNFLSELGSTMGDDTTALLCLASLCVLVMGERTTRRVLAAGVLMGLAIGLKLTNAIYGLALCAAILASGGNAAERSRAMFLCAIAVGVGAALTGGWWHYRIWSEFGNPLFPQFSTLFPNALTRSVMVVDDHWFPKGVVERLAWPFIFSWDSHRVGQIRVRQALWPMVYVLVIAWLVLRARATARHQQLVEPYSRAALFLGAYIAVAYLAWMQTFSIYRYLIAAELLVPLAIFALLGSIFPYAKAARIALLLVGGSALLTLAGGFQTWGHKRLTVSMYEVEVPEIREPRATGVVIVSPDPPYAWLATRFPPEVAFAQIGGSFPEGPAFAPTVRRMMEARAAVFAIVERPDKARPVLQSHGFVLQDAGCRSYRARMGGGESSYQWCPLALARGPP